MPVSRSVGVGGGNKEVEFRPSDATSCNSTLSRRRRRRRLLFVPISFKNKETKRQWQPMS